MVGQLVAGVVGLPAHCIWTLVGFMAGVDVDVHSEFGAGDKPFATVITGELTGHIVAF